MPFDSSSTAKAPDESVEGILATTKQQKAPFDNMVKYVEESTPAKGLATQTAPKESGKGTQKEYRIFVSSESDRDDSEESDSTELRMAVRHLPT